MGEDDEADPLEELHALERGERRPKPSFDPDKDAVFAGISGLEVKEEAELAPGIRLRPAYVDVFSHPLAAFAPPPGPRQPHPAPWAAVEGGFGFNIRVEASFAPGATIGELPRTQALWLLSAVLRLWVPRPIRTALIANMPLDALGPAWNRCRVLAFEGHSGQTGAWLQEVQPLTEKQIHDVGRALQSAARLLRDERFERAFTIYDQVNWSGGLGAASLLLWTSIEAVFAVGRGLNMGKRLAAAVSDYVTDDRSERDRLYPKVRDAYKRRGHIAHAGTGIEPDGFIEASRLGRAVFRQALVTGTLPQAVEE